MTTKVLHPALLADALGLAAFAASCAEMGADADNPADTTAIEKTISDGETQGNADYKAKDLAKIVTHYAPAATLM